MARIRTIKPEFFRHEGLYELERESGLPARVAFAGLWTVVDREGRFVWKPRALKLDCLPYDECDFASVLEALESKGFVIRYKDSGRELGFIPSWHEHQVVNIREAKSLLPEPNTEMYVHAHASTAQVSHIPRGVNIPSPLRQTVIARDGGKCVRCGAVDDLTVDHIFPQSIGGTHAISNLRCLCRSCNSARPVAGPELIADLAIDGLTLNDMQRMCMHVQVQGEGKGREGKGTRVNALFEDFWKAYPKKTAKDDARKAFDKRKPDGEMLAQMLTALAVQIASPAWTKDGGQFIPNPATWLNGGRWQDENTGAPARSELFAGAI
jgi:hypothetical protein